MREVEAFLPWNPLEIVMLILEDYGQVWYPPRVSRS